MFAIWVTGLPASGKSTMSRILKQRLNEMGIASQVLETDVLRQILTPNPTYTPEERDFFYQVMIYIGELLYRNGVSVIFDATANLRKHRDLARQKFSPDFAEIYIKCPLEICMNRDPKGIYRMGKSGRFTTVPGLQSTYEEPLNPELLLPSEQYDSPAMARKTLEKLLEMGLLKNGMEASLKV